MNQVKAYKPPPNPAKMTDSRFTVYEAKHGNKSWELDALDPKVIGGLIRRKIKSLIVEDKWDAAIRRENKDIKELETLARSDTA
jgi:hypothetical protein